MLRRSYALFLPLCLCMTLSLGAEVLPEYVVTASRDAKEVMNEPAKVTVITAEEIEKSGKTSLVQVLETVPGIRFTSIAGEAQAQVSMRGFSENSFARVKVLVDGHELNNPDMNGLNWFSIPVSSIERIEIVDGPSGVLYGSGAVSGVINIITKEQGKGFTAGANLSYGSFSTMRGLVNAGYGTESVGFNASADWYQTDGYRKRTKTTDANANLNGFWDATDLLTFKPSFSYADIYYQLPGSLTKDQFLADRTQASASDDDATERDVSAGLLAEWKASKRLGVELPVSYIHKTRTSDMVSYYSYYSYDQHQFSAKPKLSWDNALAFGSLSVNGGLDFDGFAFTASSYADSARTSLSTKYTVNQQNYAPYISSSIAFPSGISVDAGVRYSMNFLQATDTISGGSWNKPDASLVYEAAVNWRPVDTFSVYAKHNSLFRTPMVDEYFSYYATPLFNSNLAPETGYNFEVGTIWKPVQNLSAKLNAYCLLMNNEISWGTTSNENLAATRRLGGAFEASYTPVEVLEVRANVAYVNAVFASGSNEGKNVPLVPALKTGGDVKVTLPAGVALTGDVSFTSACYQGNDTSNVQDTLPAYTLLGAGVEIVPPAFNGKFAIRARGDNLLDAAYSTLAYYSTYSGATGYYPAAGRSFTISVAIKY